MELKEKLKQLRKARNLTQAQLAEQLYVSRSTVAKWESGLGLPNPEAMEALARLYGITLEQKTASLAKPNQWKPVAAAAGLLLGALLLWALLTGRYGFTPEVLADYLGDDLCWETDGCRIYYTSFSGDWADGRHWEFLTDCRVVKRQLVGWTRSDVPAARIITLNNRVVGRLHSIPMGDRYCNILCVQISNDMPDALVTATAVQIRGVEYPVDHCIFFVTPEHVNHFFIGNLYFDIA